MVGRHAGCPVKFLGVDLGWRTQPSGVALIEVRHGKPVLIHTDRVDSIHSVLRWIDGIVGPRAAMIAVDAPLVIPNESGMREADRLTHVHFGRFDAGCYPANRGLPFAARVTAFSEALYRRGYDHAAEMIARERGRYQIEVYPHAAAVNLFGQRKILKYKKGRLADRAVALRKFRKLLSRPLDGALPTFEVTGRSMKAAEDRLDAVLCAYVGWYWWRWGTARSIVLGTKQDGYIVIPSRAS